ncbi:glycosyltransferase family 4 protein [Paraburkholderia sp. Ac-20336]|uniref:glycosyltransferase n=1 Tax=unclassified Paraburkholderia TaxID=2615204 RepID=UPI001422AA10|nr:MULTISPECIES: glycosyltransferase [unclassified Paraburkholderia]MBN3804181.1 glycosyltransferase family 4 protein [Paraburkholderia sp. Ac-20336]
MKLCLCNNRFPPHVVGGTEVVVYDLAVQLRDRGHDVSIFTLSDSRSAETVVVDGLHVHSMPNTNIYNQFSHAERSGLKKALFGALDTFNPLVFFYALRHLRRLGIDVLCTNNLKGMGPAIWLAAWCLRIPVVHVLHDYWLICPTSTMFRNGRACEQACKGCRSVSAPKAWFSRLVGHVVGVSEFVLERHRRQNFFGAAQPCVIHNARQPFSAVPATPVEPRKPFRIGFIGRTDATKGIREFFAGAAAARTGNLELHIAGRDNERILDQLIAEYPDLRVVRYGFMPAKDFYPLVDLVVVTSMWNEPFGMVAFEPWEFFKPSIAFTSGGLPEVFSAFPELTVPRGDVAALGALIRRFIDDPAFYRDMARRCHERRSHFLPPRQLQQFEAVLRAAARRDRRAASVSVIEADRDARS